jgi:spermidine/putrescine transport system permease protein
VLGFWFPEGGRGVIGNDSIAIPRSAKNPVLAHHFLNFLLDEKHGYDNFVNFVGYQPPFTSIDPDRLVAEEIVPANLQTAVVRESDLSPRSCSSCRRRARRSGRRPGPSSRRVSRVSRGGRPRALVWPGLAFPGIVWLALFFFVPFYVIACVAFGSVDPIFLTPRPLTSGGSFQVVFLRTLAYVVIAVLLSLLIAYPVAYYVARFGGRWKGLLLLGLIAPFFISYLMRMLAWINLLQDDGWVNDVLLGIGILDEPRTWLDGRASSVILGMVYGYVPFMILPLYAFLDRIDRSMLEAARDLGASPFQAFRLVTLPLSLPAILAGIVIIALPMFGDYYTPDLLSQSPKTSLIGNQINLYIRGGQQVPVGAALVVVLMLFLAVLLAYYVVATARAQKRLHG